ncbi:MAG: nucleoside 2-deoxyribosyltransferase [Clostridia bacterium]
MNIYFSGSIYGGRQKLEAYKKLIKELSKFGKVLNEEVADDNVILDEANTKDSDIFESLEERINKADLIFAEVTVPSLGVGYEIGYADKTNKRIICVYDKTVTPKLTTMLRGNNRLKIIPYTDINEIINDLENILKEEN